VKISKLFSPEPDVCEESEVGEVDTIFAVEVCVAAGLDGTTGGPIGREESEVAKVQRI
jgi:hypothetical protein